MILRAAIRLGALFALLTGTFGESPRVDVGTREDYNPLLLRVLGAMPAGGGYATNSQAMEGLAAAIKLDSSALLLTSQKACPSFCSGATYLVFLGAVGELIRSGRLTLDQPAARALLVQGQRDGEGIWGRWNANGPGTARLFAELNLGSNFTDWSKARPGDFMKIFWSNEIGKLERGHSVIYLGRQTVEGVEHVNFWSSNRPLGYGFKLVPRSRIAWAVFSRLERPAELARADALPPSDPYLASLLTTRSNQEEVRSKCSVDLLRR
jgi:hypothetical protein